MRQFIDKFYLSKRNKLPTLDKDWDFYWDLAYQTVKNLETEEGILASGKAEIYGCIFGRDSLITSLKLLKVYKEKKDARLLNIVRKVLQTLAHLQGKNVNIQSGEEPGKCIHEYRPNNHEHLTKNADHPWYLYPDQVMRNYDSVDSTPLFLITVYRYFQASQDLSFLKSIEPQIHAAINWIFEFGDLNEDGFIDYQLHPERKFGGLLNQNWMDSTESVFHEDESPVVYPVAPVEAQAYTYLALKLWANYFTEFDSQKSEKLFSKAYELKQHFNRKFVIDGFVAPGLDGTGKPFTSTRSSIGHCLWAATTLEEDGEIDSILDSSLVENLVSRLLREDIFEPEAGIRTLSKSSKEFSSNSYHNGSIWPHDNSMIAEGFENFGFLPESQKVRRAILKAISFFGTPIELFVYENSYTDYVSPSGQVACKSQAWSAAAILRSISYSKKEHSLFQEKKQLLDKELLVSLAKKLGLAPYQKFRVLTGKSTKTN